MARSILTIDDDDDIRSLIRYHLEKAGHIVHDVSGGIAGFTKACNTAFDLILLDLMMPNRDGFYTFEKLKSSTLTKYIPVMFLTSSSAKKDVIKSIEMQCSGYMVKPIEFDKLLIKIDDILGPDISQQRETEEYEELWEKLFE